MSSRGSGGTISTPLLQGGGGVGCAQATLGQRCRLITSYVVEEFRGAGDKADETETPSSAEYGGKYLRATVWCVLLLSGWGLTRLTCAYDLPSDCNLANHPLEVMSDVQVMLTYGVMQAWLCEVLVPKRFSHLMNRRRLWYFLLSFYGSGLIFSAVSDLPGLSTSLSSGESYTVGQLSVFILLAAVLVMEVVWHFWYAWYRYHTDAPKRLRMYFLSRGSIFIYFFAYVVLVLATASTYEFHHYAVAWAASLIAQFESAFSSVWLGCCAGIFVQGCGAYRTAFLFYEQD